MVGTLGRCGTNRYFDHPRAIRSRLVFLWEAVLTLARHSSCSHCRNLAVAIPRLRTGTVLSIMRYFINNSIA